VLRIDSSRIAGKPSRSLRPLPAIVGAITSLSSSTTPAASSAWTTEMLACTPMSAPGWFLRSRTNATSSPSTTLVLAHFGSRGAEVATYFATPLMNVADGSMSLSGQNPAHAS
jgi:hypothetical protein